LDFAEEKLMSLAAPVTNHITVIYPDKEPSETENSKAMKFLAAIQDTAKDHDRSITTLSVTCINNDSVLLYS
jgi:hypothetical protein